MPVNLSCAIVPWASFFGGAREAVQCERENENATRRRSLAGSQCGMHLDSITTAVSLPSKHTMLHCSSSDGFIVPDAETLRRFFFRQLRRRYQKGPEHCKRSAERHTVT